MSSSLQQALNRYRSVGTQSAVEGASPHRLIAMLMDAAMAKLATALGHMRRGEIGPKGESIGAAISIIGGLQSSLNRDLGGEIAENLDHLYDYMQERLLEATRRNDPVPLEEVRRLLGQIKDGWDRIPALVQDQGAQAAGVGQR